MVDPRIAELMDYVDAVDASGEPTLIALIARRVESYLEVIEGLRTELEEHHDSVNELEIRAVNILDRVKERDAVRVDITEMAQTTAMEAAYTATASRAAELRKNAAEKQKELRQFEADYAEDEKRYKDATRALSSKQDRLMELRDQIARRMNIVDALLQRAEIEWPSYFFDENERLKAKKKSASSPIARRRSGRGGGRRTIIRRRKAS